MDYIMLEKIPFFGLTNKPNPYAVKEHYLEYIIDTDIPSVPPIVGGDADLWVNMQNMYYAIVNITRQYKVTGDTKNIYYDEYEMTIHLDVLTPYDRLAVTIQQFIQEIIGPANRIFGTIKVYRKTTKYVPKEGWYIVHDTPGMNVHQKLD